MPTEGGMKIAIGEQVIPILNIYAPSGNNKKTEREKNFATDLLYYLRHNADNIIFGGDFNCITSLRDVSNVNENLIPKSLISLM